LATLNHQVAGTLCIGRQAVVTRFHPQKMETLRTLALNKSGTPRALRSDNAGVFRSRVFRWGCRLAGIKQQFSVPGCPWMNGRIERLFGTLKQKLDLIEINTREALLHLLGDFNVWYNVVRPHQNLAGLTPDEAWHGNNPYINAPRSVHWFEAWDGLLKGYYLRC
jgi:transposase InsO family protein